MEKDDLASWYLGKTSRDLTLSKLVDEGDTTYVNVSNMYRSIIYCKILKCTSCAFEFF